MFSDYFLIFKFNIVYRIRHSGIAKPFRQKNK